VVQAPKENATPMKRKIRDMVVIQKTSLSLVSLSHTILHGLALRLGMTKKWSRQISFNLYVTSTMRYLATILIILLLAVPAMSVELFRYRGAEKDGGTLDTFLKPESKIPPTPV
jgi:hypothetical protein